MTVAVPLEHPVKDRLFTPAQRAFWEENGYVIIPDAVPQGNLEAVIDAIWAFLQVDRDDPETWYDAPVSRAGMLEMFHHQSLGTIASTPESTRHSQMCGSRKSCGVSIDRANMNPPARTPDWDYNGMFHWDIDTTLRPLPRMVQGVLYLTDTTAEQGGFQWRAGFSQAVP